MGNTNGNKIVVFGTHGLEDVEMATLPFVAATGALAMDTKAVIVLQGEGVMVAKKGAVDGLVAPGFPPLADLIKNLFEFGGELLLCTPCLESRNITDDEIVEGAVKVKTGRVITEVLNAKSTLNY